MRETRVGGLGSERSVASLSIFSRADFSVSMNLSNSGCAEGRGMASVAMSTMDARFPTSSAVELDKITMNKMGKSYNNYQNWNHI